MGPRPFSRGNKSAATASDVAAGELQWGHGLSAVEMVIPGGETKMRRDASMGPRPFSRGNPGSACLCDSQRHGLQWGHGLSAVEIRGNVAPSPPGACFNGATAFQPWKWPVTTRPSPQPNALQWGHGLSAVEMASRGVCCRSRFSGFNGATAFQPWKLGLHKFHRGWQWMLQWGHGLSAVEIGLIYQADYAVTTLQWGHGLSAVEIIVAVRNHAAERRRFNGATAFQPWKSARLVRQRSSTWGFNGATAFQPWKSPRRSRSRGLGERCFNGATAFQPWKWFFVATVRPSGSMWLQWGHGLSAVEISPPRMGAGPKGGASMGPRPFSRGNTLVG